MFTTLQLGRGCLFVCDLTSGSKTSAREYHKLNDIFLEKTRTNTLADIELVGDVGTFGPR